MIIPGTISRNQKCVAVNVAISFSPLLIYTDSHLALQPNKGIALVNEYSDDASENTDAKNIKCVHKTLLHLHNNRLKELR